jgi:UDP-N-acetylmuramyl tripeptide synthase
MEIAERLWLLGAGRRSENTVFEQQFLFDAEEQALLQAQGQNLPAGLKALLSQAHHSSGLECPAFHWNGNQPQLAFCELFAALAVYLQVAAGHRVGQYGAAADGSGQGCWVWFEYEHDAVAAASVVLALHLLNRLEPGIRLPDFTGEAVELAEVSWAAFLELAKPRILPPEAEAILKAAVQKGIPCVKLERAPYQGVEGNFRIRRNGLLKLGHGAHQVIVDGCVCVGRSANLLTLLHNRPARRALMAGLNLPLPVHDPQAGNCVLTKHALRTAERLGFPVTLTVTANNGQQFTWPDIASADELRRTLDQARRYGAQAGIEASVGGEDWQLLLVATEPFALLRQGEIQPLHHLNDTTLQHAKALASHLGSGILLLHVRTSDIGARLSGRSGAFMDFELAPRLDEVLARCPGELARAAGALVDWLFPPGTRSRIPIVAITGTNGKTTTSRMIEAIARKSGLGTGLTCTGGIYLDGTRFYGKGKGGIGRQYSMFEHESVQFAVLEEYFGTVLRTGFMYDWCDVAVCTNVAEDHIGRIGAYTVADIAAVKALVVQRARKAAILNADNSYSLGMMALARSQNIGLVSLQRSAAELRAMLDRPGEVCVLEPEAGEQWLVMYAGEERIPLLRIRDLPSSFNGAAAHNTCNAMQAALACHLAGLEVEHIRAALAGFHMDFATAPGRLNVMEGLPFKFVLDYAHNLEGFRALCAFLDQLEVSGRRMLCIAASGDRRDLEIREFISFLAGHFDYFICRRYKGLRGRSHEEIPRLIESCLLAAGVPASAIQLELDPDQAVQQALQSAGPGDLLVVLTGTSETSKIWKQAEALKAGPAPDEPSRADTANGVAPIGATPPA